MMKEEEKKTFKKCFTCFQKLCGSKKYIYGMSLSTENLCMSWNLNAWLNLEKLKMDVGTCSLKQLDDFFCGGGGFEKPSWVFAFYRAQSCLT